MTNLDADLIWKYLLEASAQTFVGALTSFSLNQIIKSRLLKKRTFHGPLDVWQRGLHGKNIEFEDPIRIECLISPYAQLFPGDPYQNAKKWSQIYEDKGGFSREVFQALDFFCGSDQAIRLKSLNGETIVGIFARYGYIGEGLIGIAPTKLIKKTLPDFFEKDFFGVHANITGVITKCPSQHWAIFQSIARNSNIPHFSNEFLAKRKEEYREIPYIKIHSIEITNGADNRFCSLLGSSWAVTDKKREQYLIQYGHFSDQDEIKKCHERLRDSKSWKNIRVFFDDMTAPSNDVSFTKNFF